MSARSIARRAKNKAEGKCVECCGTPLATKTRCQRCREANNRHARASIARAVAAGLCRNSCGKPAVPGHTKCEECAEKNRKAADRQRARA